MQKVDLRKTLKDNRLRRLRRKGVSFSQIAEIICVAEKDVRDVSRGNAMFSQSSDELLESLVCVAEYLDNSEIKRHLGSDNHSLSGLFLDALENES